MVVGSPIGKSSVPEGRPGRGLIPAVGGRMACEKSKKRRGFGGLGGGVQAKEKRRGGAGRESRTTCL